MKKHRKILNDLFIMARDYENNTFRSKHASAIYIKNKLICYGFNEPKTHPFQSQFCKNEESLFWHSETRAIHNALRYVSKEDLVNATIYIARAKFDYEGNSMFGMSKPCEGCMKAIKTYGIKNIIYTNDTNEPNIFSYSHDTIGDYV